MAESTGNKILAIIIFIVAIVIFGFIMYHTITMRIKALKWIKDNPNATEVPEWVTNALRSNSGPRYHRHHGPYRHFGGYNNVREDIW